MLAPWAITIKGSTPQRSRCMVPPILKLWPERIERWWKEQTSLHLSRNQVLHIGSKALEAISKLNKCPEGGTCELTLGIHMGEYPWVSHANIS